MLCLRSMMQWLILLWFAESQKFIIRHSGGWTTNGQWPWLWHSAHCPTTPAIPQLWCQSPVIPFTLYFCFAFLHYIWLYTQIFLNLKHIHKIYYGMFTKLHCIKYLLNILNIHCTKTTKYQSNSDSLILNVNWNLMIHVYVFVLEHGRVWDLGPLFRDKNNMHSTGSERHQKICLNWRKPNGRNLQNQHWWTRRRPRQGETRSGRNQLEY